MNKVLTFVKQHYLVLLFITVYTLFLGFKLATHVTPFYDWDESIYAQVGREMIHAKSLLPLWQGTIWLDKPPLVPLVYGVVLTVFSFIQPEVSTRIFTLFLASIALFLCYLLYFKATKNKIVSALTVVLTAFNPIFLQRAQVLNIDIFVLIAWVGYVLSFPRFRLSLFFLFIGVMSKSLIGFYPIGLFIFYYGYEFLQKKISKQQLITHLKALILQTAILGLWFAGMLLIYGHAFWQNAIIDAHFRRVTASIESHFGQRTYYLDLIFQQYGPLSFLAFFSVLVMLFQLARKKMKTEFLLYSLYLLPWFLFLNLTKTKIFWYIYPVVPQFAFLIVYPLTFIEKKKVIFYLVALTSFMTMFYTTTITHTYLTDVYSKQENYLTLASYAKPICTDLHVLVGRDTRESFDTLDRLHLLITTSRWWGNHPSMVYYFGKKIIFEYDKNSLQKTMKHFEKNECLSVEKDDLDLKPESFLAPLQSFGTYYLYEKL